MKEKADNLIKTPSKIQSFEEVQKALQDLAKQLNDLGIATNSSAEGEITDKDGKTGDIRITQNEDKTYGLELKTEEGWKFPTVGESPVQLTGKKGEKARPDAVVDKFKDELGKAKNFPAADYDSGWVEWDHSLRIFDNGTNCLVLDHNLGGFPNSYVIYFSPQAPDSIEWWTRASGDGGYSTHTGILNKVTSTQIFINAGDSYSLISTDFVGSDVTYLDGSIRVLMWK